MSQFIAFRVTALNQTDNETTIRLISTNSYLESEIEIRFTKTSAHQVRVFVGDEYDIEIKPHITRD